MLNRRALVAAAGGLLVSGVRAGAAATPPVLTRSGNRVLWNGAPIILRGLAVADPLDARAARPTADYAAMATAWNANVVRISVESVTWRDSRARVLPRLVADVSAALAANMFVIICWHTIGWPNGRVERRDWYTSDFSLCREFWTAMRDRYGQDGRIMFELWNEPLSATAWGEPNTRTWPQLRSFHAQLVSLIRATSGNLILCSTDWNSYDLRGVRASPVAGSNIAYVWHCYPINGRGSATEWARMVDGLDRTHPVLVTEWGFSPSEPGQHYHGTAASYGTPLLRFMAGRGLHWTAWCYHDGWTPALLRPDWRTTTAYGTFVKAALRDLGAQARPR